MEDYNMEIDDVVIALVLIQITLGALKIFGWDVELAFLFIPTYLIILIFAELILIYIIRPIITEVIPSYIRYKIYMIKFKKNLKK